MSSNPITGNMNITETGSDFISKPTEAQGYLGAAKGMLCGAIPLGNIAPIPAVALTLLCGHASEAALKAILAKSGISANELSRPPYSHSILTLWQGAEQVLTLLPSPRPDWVGQLDRVYDKPFYLRYPLGFHGIVLPDQTNMLSGTESLVMFAESYVNA